MIGLAIVQAYYRKLDYDLARDFAPVTKIGFGTVVLVVPPSLKVASVKELIALAKAKPGQMTFASSGIGGLIHLTGELFKQMAGVDIVHVPYKGTTQLLPDLLDGRVSMAIDSLPAHLPHIKAGRLRALGVARRTRSPQLPGGADDERGGTARLRVVYGLRALRARRHAEAHRRAPEQGNERGAATARSPREARGIGIEIAGSTPEALQAEVVGEIAKWTKIIKDANIKQE